MAYSIALMLPNNLSAAEWGTEVISLVSVKVFIHLVVSIVSTN